MRSRLIRFVVCLGFGFAFFVGGALALSESAVMLSGIEIAARYHLRTRSTNFYQRASSGAARPSSTGFFRR
jgi:hypothetical protein